MSNAHGQQNALPPLSYGAVLEVLDELPTAMRVVRRVRRLSGRAAAEEIGISSGQLLRIEDGIVDCRMETLRLILRWLNTQPDIEFHQASDTHG